MESFPPTKKTVLIAGGGVAGLSASVFLDELGYEVSLFEKKPILGGRTYSFQDKKTGAIIDNGQHLLIGAYHETIAFLEAIGAKHFLKIDIPTVVPLVDKNWQKSNFILGKARAPFHLIKAVFTTKLFSFTDKLKFIKIGAALQKNVRQPNPDLQNKTVKEWLTEMRQSDASQKNFWDILTLATLNDLPDITTADGLAQVLIQSYFTEQNNGYLIFPTVGLSDLFVKPAQNYLESRRQNIIHEGIKEIRVLNNKVQCFVGQNGSKYKADLYVSAMPFRQLLQALPQAVVQENPQLKNLHRLQSSPIISINLFYDTDIMTEKFIGSANAKVHWFFSKNRIMKENNTQWHHIMGVISGAYEFLHFSKDEIIQMAQQDLAHIYPKSKDTQLVHALVNKETEATLSSRLGINVIRPKQKIFDNFYVIGDWTQTGLPATIESAIKSARLMRDDLL